VFLVVHLAIHKSKFGITREAKMLKSMNGGKGLDVVGEEENIKFIGHFENGQAEMIFSWSSAEAIFDQSGITKVTDKSGYVGYVGYSSGWTTEFVFARFGMATFIDSEELKKEVENVLTSLSSLEKEDVLLALKTDEWQTTEEIKKSIVDNQGIKIVLRNPLMHFIDELMEENVVEANLRRPPICFAVTDFGGIWEYRIKPQ